jgi:hypothetical protein
LDNRRSYTIKPCPNGLSDHDGQILTLLNLLFPPKGIKLIHTIKFDNNTVTDFQSQLAMNSGIMYLGVIILMKHSITFSTCTCGATTPASIKKESRTNTIIIIG